VNIDDFAALARRDDGLCVVTTPRSDASMQASVVNVGLLAHPLTGQLVVGFVAGRASRKLVNLRVRPNVTVVARLRWTWVAVEGTAEIIGPDDPVDGIDGERLRILLREIFASAGGVHEDLEVYDAAMAAEGRAAVLVHPGRVYSNP
jgi:PPOX class probable F420-dependent enzyme